jgi:hypothetical protein
LFLVLVPFVPTQSIASDMDESWTQCFSVGLARREFLEKLFNVNDIRMGERSSAFAVLGSGFSNAAVVVLELEYNRGIPEDVELRAGRSPRRSSEGHG